MKTRPRHLLPLFSRAAAGNSRASAIKAMCLECVGFVRKEITLCTAHDCPLYTYRPFQTEDEAEDAVPPADIAVGTTPIAGTAQGAIQQPTPRRTIGRPFQKRGREDATHEGL